MVWLLSVVLTGEHFLLLILIQTYIEEMNEVFEHLTRGEAARLIETMA